MRLAYILAVALIAASLAGCAAESERKAVQGETGAIFLRQAAQGSLSEIVKSKLALQRGQNPEVRQFAERMITDHEMANQQLQSVARSKGYTLPDETNDSQREEAITLAQLEGARFEKEYMGQMVADHAKTIRMFDEQARSARDPEIRRVATSLLPTLKQQYEMAQGINLRLSQQ